MGYEPSFYAREAALLAKAHLELDGGIPLRNFLELELIADNALSGAGIPDSSNHGRHAVQATSASQPTSTHDAFGVHSGLTFDGSDDYMVTPNLFALSLQYTVLAVVEFGGTGSYGGIFTGRSNTDQVGPGLGVSPGGVLEAFQNLGNIISVGYYTSGQKAVVAMIQSATQFSLWMNGIVVGQKTAAPPTGVTYPANCFIGTYRATTGNHMAGKIAYIAVFSKALSQAELDTCTSFLQRFGVISAQRSPGAARWIHDAATPILAPTQGWETTAIQEPRIVYRGPGDFVMAYSGGDTLNNEGIGWATSSDGKTWVKSANPIVGQGFGGHSGGAGRGNLLWLGGSNFELYFTESIPGSWTRVVSSDGGATWGGKTVVMAANAAPSGYTGYANSHIEQDGGVWRLVIELCTAGGSYDTFTYTSADRVTWSGGVKLSGLQVGTGSVSACGWKKEGSVYHLFTHNSPAGILPTDIYHHTSADFVNWTNHGVEFSRADEINLGAFASGIDQVADVRFAFAAGKIFAVYARCYNGGGIFSNIGLATYTGTLASLLG